MGLEEAVASVRKLHREVLNDRASYCDECSWLGAITIEYPCPTIRAIEKVLE